MTLVQFEWGTLLLMATAIAVNVFDTWWSKRK